MVDFFLRNEDEKLAEGATHLDDLDLVPSKQHVGPWGPCLVAVAMKHGEHVCWQCGGYFDREEALLKPVEIQHGYSIILLHRKCVGRPRTQSSRGFDDIIRGMQARRFMAKGTKALAKAAEAPQDSPLIVPSK